MILTSENLNDVRAKNPDEKVVLTSGTFDLFHVGHLRYLERVKKYGDILIVMLSGDQRVKARKGPGRPIINEGDRAEILDAIKIVDFVFIDPSQLGPDEIDPIHQEILNNLKPDFYVTDGPDPRFVNLLDKSKFIILDRTDIQTSTTDIINSIRER